LASTRHNVQNLASKALTSQTLAAIIKGNEIERGYINTIGKWLFNLNPINNLESGYIFEHENGYYITSSRLIYIWLREFSENRAAVYTFDAGGKQSAGYIDKSGRFFISQQFHYAHSFSEGLAAVYVLD
jgi:hypothetical protein